jgi:hypothetical protein
LPGDLNSRQRHRPPPASRDQVEVLLVGEVERGLERELRGLLGRRGSRTNEQDQE